MSTDTKISSNIRLGYLDGWRGLAILAVLLGHFTPVEGFNFGTFGVELFFVLSGRLMADILFIKKIPLGVFYRRRLSRIYPGLLVYVLAVWAASWRSTLAFGPKAALSALTFVSNYSVLVPGLYRTPVLDHIWSLCVEEHAYVLLGIIAYFASKRGFSARALIALLTLAAMLDGIISSAVFQQNYFDVYWRTDVHVASILSAVSFYLMCEKYRTKLHAMSFMPLVPVIAFAASVLLNIQEVPHAIKYSLGTLCLALSVCTLESAPSAVLRALSNTPLRYIGIASYSLYLWQQPFYKILADSHEPAAIVATIVPAVICGLISYFLIETPARKWLNARWSGKALAGA